MRHLKSLNKYFWKYRWLFLLGVVFIILSNYFRILSPQVTKYVLNVVEESISEARGANSSETSLFKEATGKRKSERPAALPSGIKKSNYDPVIQKYIVEKFGSPAFSFKKKIIFCGILLLALALVSGFFMFLMRQTIIVMSRHIEYEQKNEIFNHYQKLDTAFYKTHNTGDLMNRISEDVSRVRMFTGPAVMYVINLAATIGFSVFYMLRENKELTLYVLSPLPVLAITIYYVNNIINRKSDRIQSLLSDLTTNAQESYSGIRVIKSFVQENAMLGFFENNSKEYRKNAISLAKTESIYFPAMSLLIGLSTLLTIMIGGLYVMRGQINIGVLGEFVMYILLLTFPVMAIGWTASMIQRASTSQRRINEFLHTVPTVQNQSNYLPVQLKGNIEFVNVDFTYPHTGIHAIKRFNLKINKGEKIAIIGKTGSGKSTLAQLLLRMYDPQSGDILYDSTSIKQIDLTSLRSQLSYVPQDVFLFSDTVYENIGFGVKEVTEQDVIQATNEAVIDKEIQQFPAKYQTLIGERGVTLSGGQKQRISIARALIKKHEIVIFDDCLSAVDAKTENQIINNLHDYLADRTAIIITHRIFSLFNFDKIILLKDGAIAEEGTHMTLINRGGLYAEMYYQQQMREKQLTGVNGQ